MAGRRDQVAGAAKRTVGKAVGNRRLQTEGTVQETVGKAKSAAGKLRAKAGAKKRA
ncbi:MAG: CsbD family protein [Candidatus Dormibacteria bacterium]